MSEGKQEQEKLLEVMSWKLVTDQALPILTNEEVSKIHDPGLSHEKFTRENPDAPIKNLSEEDASRSAGLNKKVFKENEAPVLGSERNKDGVIDTDNVSIVPEDSFNNGTLTASEISTNRRALFAEFCRICHGSDQEKFISPCNCKGSLTLVHKSCLERWLAQSDTAHCELCGVTFRMKREPKYDILSSFMVWFTSSSTSRDRRKIIIDFFSFLCFFPILGLVNFLIFKLADKIFSTPQYTIAADEPICITEEQRWSGFMTVGEVALCSMLLTCDIGFVSWVLIRIQYHFSRWYSWFRRSCNVTLLGYPEVNIIGRKPQLSEPTTSKSNIRTIMY